MPLPLSVFGRMISAPTGLRHGYMLYVSRDSRYLSFRHGYAVPPPSSEGGFLFTLRGEAEGMNPFPTVFLREFMLCV